MQFGCVACPNLPTPLHEPIVPSLNTDRVAEAKLTAENKCLQEQLSQAHEPKPQPGDLATEGVALSKRKLKEVGKTAKDSQKPYGNPCCWFCPAVKDPVVPCLPLPNRALQQLSQADLQLQQQLQVAKAGEAELGKQLEQKDAEIGSLQYGDTNADVFGR